VDPFELRPVAQSQKGPKKRNSYGVGRAANQVLQKTRAKKKGEQTKIGKLRSKERKERLAPRSLIQAGVARARKNPKLSTARKKHVAKLGGRTPI